MITKKQKTKLGYSGDSKDSGFTLIELLVVISIMVLVSTILIVNYNRQRGIRNLKIAQNQLATNIRKVQSYILSARDISSGGTFSPAKYYFATFNATPGQYTTTGVNSAYTPIALETIILPQGIIINNIAIPGVCPTTCTGLVRVAFSSPYGKAYIQASNDTCAAAGFAAAAQVPSCLLSLSDRQVVITLRDTVSLATKTVTVYGVSGKVEASP